MKNIVVKVLLTLLLLSSSYTVILADGEDCSEPTPLSELENTTPEVKTIDENTKQITSKYFDLTLTKNIQSPINNALPYTLVITSHMDTDKAQIIWNLPSTLQVSTHHKEYVSLKNGDTYTYTADILPQKQGTYDFSVSVIAWQYDTNYTNSIADTVTFDQNLVSQPTSIWYQIGFVLKIVIIIAIFGGLVYGVYLLGKKFSKKAKQWLTPPS